MGRNWLCWFLRKVALDMAMFLYIRVLGVEEMLQEFSGIFRNFIYMCCCTKVNSGWKKK